MTTNNWACADDCTHPDHRHHEPPAPPSLAVDAPRRCANKGCRKLVKRNRDEKLAAFNRRSTCSTKCRQARDKYLREVTETAKWALLETKHMPCVICDQRFFHRENETIARYTDRATCGKAECIRELIGRKNRDAAKTGNTHYNTQRRIGMIGPEAVIDFSSQNLAFKPDLRRVSKPFVQSYGVSSGWVVRGASS